MNAIASRRETVDPNSEWDDQQERQQERATLEGDDGSSYNLRSETFKNMRDRFYYTDFIEKARYADHHTEKKHASGGRTRTIDEDEEEEFGLDSTASISESSAASSCGAGLDCTHHSGGDPAVCAGTTVGFPSRPQSYSTPDAPPRTPLRQHSGSLMSQCNTVCGVTFADAHRKKLRLVRKISSHREYTAREKAKCWYSRADKQKMIEKAERMAVKLEDYQRNAMEEARRNAGGVVRKNVSATNNCRGLESWTKEGGSKLGHVISMCVEAVLDEQEGTAGGYSHPDRLVARISKASLAVTEASAARAHAVALEDQAEATRAMSKPWTSDETSPQETGSSSSDSDVAQALIASSPLSPSASAPSFLPSATSVTKTKTKDKVAAMSSIRAAKAKLEAVAAASAPPPSVPQRSVSPVPSAPTMVVTKSEQRQLSSIAGPLVPPQKHDCRTKQKGQASLTRTPSFPAPNVPSPTRVITLSPGNSPDPAGKTISSVLPNRIQSSRTPSLASKINSMSIKDCEREGMVMDDDSVSVLSSPSSTNSGAVDPPGVRARTVTRSATPRNASFMKRAQARTPSAPDATTPKARTRISEVAPKQSKSVSFGHVSLRFYPRALSDNPSVQSGPAIGIGWEYFTPSAAEQPFALDDFESHRAGLGPRTRTVSSQLVLSRHEREMLLIDAGYRQNEIAEMVRAILKAKNHRKQTVTSLMAGYDGVDVAIESAKLTFGKLFRMGGFAKK